MASEANKAQSSYTGPNGIAYHKPAGTHTPDGTDNARQ
jgi:hypothetical protein